MTSGVSRKWLKGGLGDSIQTVVAVQYKVLTGRAIECHQSAFSYGYREPFYNFQL